MIEFRVEDVDKNGNLSNETDAVAWLIKEGDNLHCTCPSRETARYALQYFKNLRIEKKYLENRAHHEIVEIEGLKYVVATQLALEAINTFKTFRELMAVVSDKKNPSTSAKVSDPKDPTSSIGKLKG
ncbi:MULTISPECIES: hypothetical protein [Pseudomonas]|uniref:Uncharacterized protein n=1 Tax=Pseudomonas rhodesiae TaxID=76760 RepID=A0A8I1E531_9PSED|nr:MULTISPECIES: hypothetical protein [Pseudomonas]MBI6600555.1 hypothetical protein [Pseudomonas sp. S4_EA_1b]MBI6625298.1 hypothetical protein [Pseudomonas rhodesiae]